MDDLESAAASIRDKAIDEAFDQIRTSLGEYIDPEEPPNKWDVGGLLVVGKPPLPGVHDAEPAPQDGAARHRGSPVRGGSQALRECRPQRCRDLPRPQIPPARADGLGSREVRHRHQGRATRREAQRRGGGVAARTRAPRLPPTRSRLPRRIVHRARLRRGRHGPRGLGRDGHYAGRTRNTAPDGRWPMCRDGIPWRSANSSSR